MFYSFSCLPCGFCGWRWICRACLHCTLIMIACSVLLLSTGYMLHKLHLFTLGLAIPKPQVARHIFLTWYIVFMFKLGCIYGTTYHNSIQIIEHIWLIFQGSGWMPMWLLSNSPQIFSCGKLALSCPVIIKVACRPCSTVGLALLLSLAPSGVLCGQWWADRCFSGVCGAQGPGWWLC